MRIVIAIIGAMALSGCALAPLQSVKQFEAHDKAAGEALNQSEVYCRSLAQDRRLAPLRGKVPFRVGSITVQHMATEDKAGPSEKQALLVLAELKRKCAASARAVYQTYYPGAEHVVDAHIDRLDTITLAAYREEISLGQFNQLRRESDMILAQDFEKAFRRIAVARARAIEDEQARREAVAAAFARAGAAIQRATEEYNRNRPRTTNCNWWGNTWHCTTY